MKIIISETSVNYDENKQFKDIMTDCLKYLQKDEASFFVPRSIGGTYGPGFKRNFLQLSKDYIEELLFDVYPDPKECKENDSTEYTYVFKPLEELSKIDWFTDISGTSLTFSVAVTMLIDTLSSLLFYTNTNINHPLDPKYKVTTKASVKSNAKTSLDHVKDYFDLMYKQKLLRETRVFNSKDLTLAQTFKYQLPFNPPLLDFKNGLLVYLSLNYKTIHITKFKENLSEIEYEQSFLIQTSKPDLACDLKITNMYIIVVYYTGMIMYSLENPHVIVHKFREENKMYLNRSLYVLDDIVVDVQSSNMKSSSYITYALNREAQIIYQAYTESSCKSVGESSNFIYTLQSSDENNSFVSVIRKSIMMVYEAQINSFINVYLPRFKQMVVNDNYLAGYYRNKITIYNNGGFVPENYTILQEIIVDMLIDIYLINNILVTYLTNGQIELYENVENKFVKISSSDKEDNSVSIPSKCGISIYENSVVTFTNGIYPTGFAKKNTNRKGYLNLNKDDPLVDHNVNALVRFDSRAQLHVRNLVTGDYGVIDRADQRSSITQSTRGQYAFVRNGPAVVTQHKYESPSNGPLINYDILTDEQTALLKGFVENSSAPVDDRLSELIKGISTLMMLYESEKDNDEAITSHEHSPEMFGLLKACAQVSSDECFKPMNEDNEYSIYNTSMIQKITGDDAQPFAYDEKDAQMAVYSDPSISKSVSILINTSNLLVRPPMTMDDIMKVIYVSGGIELNKAEPSNTLTAFKQFLESIKDNTKMKLNLLRYWSGSKELNMTKRYQLIIRDGPENSRPFPNTHTCFYQMMIYNVDRFPGETLVEKTAAFVETMTTAVANFSSVMNWTGGRRTRKRVSNKNKNNHKNKNKKTKKVVKKHRKTVKRTKLLKNNQPSSVKCRTTTF